VRRALLVLALAVALAGCAATPRDSGRAAPITDDIAWMVFEGCYDGFETELGTSTMVQTEFEDGLVDVTVTGSPQDEALARALESCLRQYRYAGYGFYSAQSPFEELIVGAYQESVLQNCLEAHGVPFTPFRPWMLDDDAIPVPGNPYRNMAGEVEEIAELRRDCPPFPVFLDRSEPLLVG